YYDEEALLRSGRGTKDWNFYRYPEALLIAAEAIVADGSVNAEAAGYLAKVKARASTTGKSEAAFVAELLTLSKEKFIEECWTERLREFPLEFKMWDDIIRTKKFPVISETVKGSVTYVNLIGAQTAQVLHLKKVTCYGRFQRMNVSEIQNSRKTKVTNNTFNTYNRGFHAGSPYFFQLPVRQ